MQIKAANVIVVSVIVPFVRIIRYEVSTAFSQTRNVIDINVDVRVGRKYTTHPRWGGANVTNVNWYCPWVGTADIVGCHLVQEDSHDVGTWSAIVPAAW